MVAIKASLALPSINKYSAASSKPNSPVASPAPSETGSKRNNAMGMLDALPRARSKSGEGNKRVPSNANGQSGLAPAQPGLLPSGGSSHGILRPKLASLLSGRSTPHLAPSSPIVPSHPQGANSAGTPHPTPAPATGHATPGSGLSTAPVAIGNLEASYVTKVGMSLNDAVNKVFPSMGNPMMGALSHTHAGEAAPVIYKGLCAPRAERAREVGQMIVNELHLAVNDQYLLRSLLRSAVLKSLSIFVSRLESLLITPTAEPSILTVAHSVKDAEHPPLAQRYTFMLLRSAWELKKGLIKACGSVVGADGREDAMPKFVKETLAPWITKLDLLTNKVWTPILTAMKDEAVRLVVCQGQQKGMSPSNSTTSLALPHANASKGGLSLTRATTPLLLTHPPAAGAAVPQLNAPYLRDLVSLLGAISRTFAWVSVSDNDHQKWKASIGSSVIWKMLLTTSSKRVGDEYALRRRVSPPSSTTNLAASAGPAAVPVARRSMSAIGMGRLRGASGHAGKRSPSPPAASSDETAAKLVVEVEAFEAIIEKFVSSLLMHSPYENTGTSTNPNEAACGKGKDCPNCKGRYIPLDEEDSDDEDALPREAMQEAMTALSSFVVVLRAFAVERNPVAVLLGGTHAVDDISLAPEICPNLIRALDTLPPLILLQTLVSRIPGQYGFRAPYELWSTTWRDYEQTMKGFHTGEEWVGEVGWELLKECKKIEQRLLNGEHGEEEAQHLKQEGWLKLMRLAVTELAEVDDLEEGASQSGIALSASPGQY